MEEFVCPYCDNEFEVEYEGDEKDLDMVMIQFDLDEVMNFIFKSLIDKGYVPQFDAIYDIIEAYNEFIVEKAEEKYEDNL